MTEEEIGLQRRVEMLEQVLEQISRTCDLIPPYYAYGDNEAGVYMSNMIDDIKQLANNR
jgi:predicted nicotinamide N-methyase